VIVATDSESNLEIEMMKMGLIAVLTYIEAPCFLPCGYPFFGCDVLFLINLYQTRSCLFHLMYELLTSLLVWKYPLLVKFVLLVLLPFHNPIDLQ
jgi:hypothetical protein